MSRIRSIHPGQWTDEAFVSCSMAARLLALALRNEADDNGIFEWKPVQIKMRLFPIDAVDIAALLGELVSNGLVQRFEASGKSYGAVRNFRRYQNPRRPKPVHPFPASLGGYVGLPCPDVTDEAAERGDDEPPPFPTNAGTGSVEDDPFPTNAGTAPQREEGEEGNGNRRGMGAGDARAADDPLDALCVRIEEIAGADRHKQTRWMTASGVVAGWLARGADPDLDILPTVRAVMAKRANSAKPPPSGPEYFREAVFEAVDARKANPSRKPSSSRDGPSSGTVTAFNAGSAYSEAWKAWRDGGRAGREPQRADFEQRGAA